MSKFAHPSALILPLLLAAGLSACTCGTIDVGGNDGGDGSTNTGQDGGGGDTDGGGGDTDAGLPCGATTCAANQVCRFDTCIDPPPACTTDAECQSDAYCEAGECIPYGVGPRGETNPECKRLVVLGLFEPVVQCQWTEAPPGDLYPSHANVLSTPLVVDFNFDNDPATVKPSIVFVTYNCEDGSCGAEPGCYGVVRVVDGTTCETQHSFGAPGEIIGSVTPALGDIDGDGRPDVVTERQGGGVTAYRYDSASNQFVQMWSSFSSFNAGSCHWASLGLHDLDDDGKPEIVQNGPFPAAYDANGALIHGANVSTAYSSLLHPVVADVDNDGTMEMVDGAHVFKFNRTTRQWEIAITTSQPLGHTAIADFGTFDATGQGSRAALDGVPEVVVVSSGKARLQTLGGALIFGPIDLPGGGTGGPPTIADFDGDGRAEFGVAGATRYTVFDPDCVSGASSTECASQGATPGMLWAKVSQDQSSNITGSSVYDFEADGRAEVVYADECFSRVYDGRSGDVLFSQQHTSCTWYEYSIVADVDGDFRSEIVIPSNSNCSVSCPAIDPIHEGVRCAESADCPGTTQCVKDNASDAIGRCRCTADADCGSPNLTCVDPPSGASPAGKVCRAVHPPSQAQRGIQVMADVLDRWVGSRPIWNQYAYAVTHVNDDGTIPKTSSVKRNWTEPGLNNFRANTQGSLSPESSPDVTGANVGKAECLPGGDVKLEARVCNRGTGPVASGVPVSFYFGATPSGAPICTVLTQQVLQPGACEKVSCTWTEPALAPGPITISADDDGTGQGGSSECEEGNNLGTLSYETCGTIG